MISNPNAATKKVSLPETGTWKVVVQGDVAGVATLATLKKSSSVSVAGHSTVVLYK